MKKFIQYSSILLSVILVGLSCSDDSTLLSPDVFEENENIAPGNALNIRLTDNPTELHEVNIDIIQVEVFDEKWDTLITNSGIYNLLDFQNGADTLIASGNIEAESIKRIRFKLGDNNYIVNNQGERFELKLPSENRNLLTIILDLELDSLNLAEILIDFDACKSIVLTGNDRWILKPVLKIKSINGEEEEEEDEDEDEEDEDEDEEEEDEEDEEEEDEDEEDEEDEDEEEEDEEDEEEEDEEEEDEEDEEEEDEDDVAIDLSQEKIDMITSNYPNFEIISLELGNFCIIDTTIIIIGLENDSLDLDIELVIDGDCSVLFEVTEISVHSIEESFIDALSNEINGNYILEEEIYFFDSNDLDYFAFPIKRGNSDREFLYFLNENAEVICNE